MYVSVKPVEFTDLELERIFLAVSSLHDDLSESSNPIDDDYDFFVDFKKEELDLLKGICSKIENNGIFSGVPLSYDRVYSDDQSGEGSEG